MKASCLMARLTSAPVLGLATLIACAAPAAAPSRSPESFTPQPPRTLIFNVRAEPVSIASLALRDNGRSERPATRMFNAGLVLQDPLNVPHPYLAEAVPQLNTESWRLTPDGRMETTYRLRPNLTWHDGQLLTAGDFAFAWEVYTLPELAVASAGLIAQIDSVLAPDDRTVLIRWRTTYPEANGVYDDLFPALPRHILETALRQGTPEAFINHPYWGAEYVGAGPFRLVRWEPGAFIEGAAFEGHALGRARIDRLQVRFISDENTVLATMLAGEVTATFSPRYEQAVTLEQHWSQSRAGTVVLIPIQPRFVHVQLRPEVARPRAVMDLRVRQALAHAINKPALDETLFGGHRAVTDSFLAPSTPYYADVDRAITKHTYDVRRTELLMEQAGFTRGAGGRVGPDGQPLVLDFWGDAGAAFERELAAIADGWREVGVETRQRILSVVETRDGELRNGFPALYSTATGTGTENNLGNYTTSGIPTAANRWIGGNRSAWSNAEYDSLWDRFTSTLDRAERNRQAVEMARILSQELPNIMLWHNFHVVAYLASLRGPDTRGVRDLTVWNVHEWTMQ